MDEDIEKLFESENNSYFYTNPDPDASKPVEKFDYAESVVSSIEAEFKNMPDVATERKNHKEELTKKLAILTKQLKNTKNIKNYKMAKQNAEIAKKRKNLREQIASIKDDLFAISHEESGENTSSSSLVDSTIQNSSKNPSSFITATNTKLFGGFGDQKEGETLKF
jgi:predicted RNase H-like nuclease (RuvC/YqgF family)